jgi:hypothetical protein
VIIYTYPNPFPLGGHVVSFLSFRLIDNIKEWCYNTYGEPGIPTNTTSRWYDSIKYGEILFRDERDVTLFLLRWSSE